MSRAAQWAKRLGPLGSRLRAYQGDRATFKTPLIAGALMLLIFAIGIACGRLLLPLHRSATGPGGLAAHLLLWDGQRYHAIMMNGYEWDPVLGILIGHFQSIAFLPLMPILERIAAILTGSTAPIIAVALSLAFGLASIFAFHRFARAMLDIRAATWATLAFALWPVTTFYIMGYPTGLISLCIIFALADHVERRFWRSALWCGIGTAAAPTMVFVFAGLVLDRAVRWIARRAPIREIPALILWGLLGVAGLLAYMIWQAVVFHDPFAFSEAQAAWGYVPPFIVRMTRLVSWSWYIQQPVAGLAEIAAGRALLRHGGATLPAVTDIVFGLQRWINVLSMIFVVIGLVLASIILAARQRAVALSGWVVLAGYAWFVLSTNQNMLAVPRLMFPAIVVFLGLGWAASRVKVAGSAMLVLFALSSILEVAFAASGYWVV